MNTKINSIIVIICISISGIVTFSCNQLGLGSDKTDNSALAAIAAYVATRSTSASSSATTATPTTTTTTTAPSALTYTGSPYTFTNGTAITTQTPTVTGAVTSCAASPTLPTGLSIAATTCAISGTPTATQAATSYTVTATNTVGSTTATISITVSAVSTSCNSSTSTASTITLSTAAIDSTTGCVAGVTSCMDSALPSWIKDNFKCAVGYVSGSSYVFKSKNLPNTKSYYYTAYTGTTPATTYSLYEALPTGNTKAGSNVVASHNFSYTIPSSPTKGAGTVGTQGGGFASIAITVNGLAVFNNAAAAPDTLATEAGTFDNYMGHPQNSGIYHHHAGTPKICDNTTSTSNSSACNNSSLIGLAIDGYAIYGQKCDKGTSSTTDDTTPTDLDSLHGHTAVTTHFSTATYHYHYANDTTATIYTLMGSFFYGTTSASAATN